MPIEIISYQLKNFEFRSPVTGIDANGEVQVGYADEKPHLISDITLLYSLQMDDSGNVVEAKGVEVANNYLMHLMVNNEPPRLFRRPVCLSQAASPDSSS